MTTVAIFIFFVVLSIIPLIAIAISEGKKREKRLMIRAVGSAFYARTVFEELLIPYKKCSDTEFEANIILLSYFCVDCASEILPKNLQKKRLPIWFASILCAYDCSLEIQHYITKNADTILNTYLGAIRGISNNPNKIIELDIAIFRQVALGCIGRNLKDPVVTMSSIEHLYLSDCFTDTIRKISGDLSNC